MLQHPDLQRGRQAVFADRQRVAFQKLRLHSRGKLSHEVGAVAMMHRNGDLRFELRHHFSGQHRVHRAPPDGRQGDVDFTEGFDLLLVELLAQVAQVRDAQRSKIENECRAMNALYEFRILMNGHVIDVGVLKLMLMVFQLAL